MSLRSYSIAFIFLFLISCGKNSTLQVNLSGAGFSDPAVSDIVFIFQSTSSGGLLDQDGDGEADSFVYPPSCGACDQNQCAAQCGYAAESGSITLGELPGGHQYTVLVILRDGAGDRLYDGTQTFNNPEANAAVNVNVD
jgi:hypothetical protein